MNSLQSVLIRSTSGGFEPRFKSAKEFLFRFSNKVDLVIWSRTVKDSIFLDANSANVFKVYAGYGRGWKNLLSHFQFFLFVVRRLRAVNPKLIYACDLDALLPSLLWRMRKRVIIVFDQFDPLSSRANNRFVASLLERLEIYLAKKSDVKITANLLRIPEYARDDWYELKNLFVIDTTLKDSPETKPPFILFYGGILARDRGLLACATAISKELDWEFHLYGQGPVSNLLKSDQYRNVFVHEPIPHKELMRAARKSDLFLAMYDPNRSNNRFTASNKLYEAAQLGIPLLTSRKTFLGELVENEGLGRSISYNDAGETSKILAEFLTFGREKTLTFQKNLQSFWAKELLEKQETIEKLSRVLFERLEA